jgi:hypothetical protein
MTVDQEYGRPFASEPYAQLHSPEIDHFVGKSFEHGHLQPLHLWVFLRSNVHSIVSKSSGDWNMAGLQSSAQVVATYPIRVLICRHRVYTEMCPDYSLGLDPRPSPDLIMEGVVIETERGLSHSRAQRLRRFIALLGNHDVRGRD